jgi:hypothetical protein
LRHSSAGGTTATGGSVPTTGDLYVATDGDDGNPGSKDKPFKTLAAAQAAVRAHPSLGKKPLTVAVAAGTYYQGKTLVFTAADSGAKDAPVTYRGFGLPTISGGVKLSLTWSTVPGTSAADPHQSRLAVHRATATSGARFRRFF